MKKQLQKVIPETYGDYSAEKKMKIYPTFRLGDDDLSDLKEMEVGKKYKLMIEVEVMAKSQGSEWNQSDKKKEINATLKVMKVGLHKEKESFETEYARKRTGQGNRYDKN